MATIDNIKLKIRSLDPPVMLAVLKFNLRFSRREVRLNLDYEINAQLREGDGAQEQFVVWQNSSLRLQGNGYTKLPCWQETVTPDGSYVKSVYLQRGFTIPKGKDDDDDNKLEMMKLFAFVQVASDSSLVTTVSSPVTTMIVGPVTEICLSWEEFMNYSNSHTGEVQKFSVFRRCRCAPPASGARSSGV